MKHLWLLAAGAAMLGAVGAGASPIPTGGQRSPPPEPPRHHFPGHGKHGFPIFVIEREVPVIVEREVVREAPPPAPSPEGEGEPTPREPYRIGASYASLPGGCMKLIEGGISYFLCSGEWYRQVGTGSGARYRAVARP